MERENPLYARVDEANTETPRMCHVLALSFAGRGMRIPQAIYDAVLNNAERQKQELAEVMDTANAVAGGNLMPNTLRNIFLDLASRMVRSYGIDNEKAAERRLDHLRIAVYSLEDSDSEGVGFTE